eukprot:UN23642
MFCGYLTTTHQGLLGLVQNASPFGDIPALAWMGANDMVISNGMSRGQADVFTNPTVVVDPEAGHFPPLAESPTYNEVLAFFANHPADGVTVTISSTSTIRTTSPDVSTTQLQTTTTIGAVSTTLLACSTQFCVGDVVTAYSKLYCVTGYNPATSQYELRDQEEDSVFEWSNSWGDLTMHAAQGCANSNTVIQTTTITGDNNDDSGKDDGSEVDSTDSVIQTTTSAENGDDSGKDGDSDTDSTPSVGNDGEDDADITTTSTIGDNGDDSGKDGSENGNDGESTDSADISTT